MCIHAIRTNVASFCVRNLPFSIIKKKCFNLSFETILTHFSSCAEMFHSVAVESNYDSLGGSNYDSLLHARSRIRSK